MKLTHITCKNADPKDKPYKITDGGGMYLYVMPNGSKYWHFKYRYAGKEKRLALGVHPDVSLQMAREKRLKARRLLDEGIDPGLEKKRMKHQLALDASNTFKLIAEEWIEHNLGTWSKNHAKTVRHRLETDIYPKIGSMPIKDINAPMLLPVLRAIENRGAHEIARRALQYLGQIFRYAIITGRCENEVTTALKGALKPFKRGHYAAMDMTEIPEFLEILNSNKARLFPQTLIAVKLLMLTFVRTSELIKATWDEFDLDTKMWINKAYHSDIEKMWESLSKAQQDIYSTPSNEWILEFLFAVQIFMQEKAYFSLTGTERKEYMKDIRVCTKTLKIAYKKLGLDEPFLLYDPAVFSLLDKNGNIITETSALPAIGITEALDFYHDYTKEELSNYKPKGKAGKRQQSNRFVRRLGQRFIALYKTPLLEVIVRAALLLYGEEYGLTIMPKFLLGHIVLTIIYNIALKSITILP